MKSDLHVGCPLPPNPLRDMRIKLEHATDLPSIKKYVPVTSKCGLGKSQGTKGLFRGMECDSYWEAAWYIYQVDILGNVVIRNTKDSFEYFDETGNKARFYPDFKMQGQFHEIKGIFRPNDVLKKDATIGLVTFWGPAEMKPIIKEVYKHDPNWKTEYIEIMHATKYGK
jgi:hypothetical protein